MDLSGVWRAAPVDEELRRLYHQADFDAGDWHDVAVPGHWEANAALSGSDDGVLYRHRFTTTTETTIQGERRWLELDGLFYQGDVYLDGEYLGDTEGYFIEHAFDVTSQLGRTADHLLALEVSCRPAGSGKRRDILGVFEGANDVIHDGNPGGIWAPVRLRSTGPVRIASLRAICLSADTNAATVGIRATLDSQSARSVRIATTLCGEHHEAEHSLAEGTNEIEWHVTVSDPELWWPAALGDQQLHDLEVAIETRQAEVSDHRTLAIGLRSITLRRWRASINGERLHLKGCNLAPSSLYLADATPDRILSDLRLALDAGFDLVRPYAHVAPPAFYDHADRLGLLVWQDFPLLGAASNSIRRKAVQQAAAMVQQLGHHPSIAVWNAHVGPAEQTHQAEPPSVRRTARRLVAHQLPTWTKSVLDRSIKNVFDSQDGSRASTAFTGVLPHLPRLDGSATHLWFGWRRGTERDLPDYAARLPGEVRFVAEFGAQSVPTSPEVTRVIEWPLRSPQEMAATLGYEAASFDRYVPPIGHAEVSGWVDATQHYQAGLLRRQIEALRRIKYMPNGGFCVHFLRDAQPRVSASLVDHEGSPKVAYGAVTQACLPVIVVADRLPARVTPGQAVAIDIHVVNDLRRPLEDAVLDAELAWPGGSHHWRYSGSVDADAVARIATLSWVAPDAPGLATLVITLSGPASATNRYDATIRRHA